MIDGQGPGSNPGVVGEFRAGPADPDRVLTPNSVDVATQFQAKVTGIGAQGADEQCFDPALKALTAPLSTTTNAGFIRQNASLAIICVTDDQDYSPNSATYYLAALQNIKGASFKTLFSLSAIAVFQQNCGVPDDGAYANMVQWTGGVKEEICTSDWAKTLENISQVAFGVRGTFYLTAPVDQTSTPIEVKIDGVALPPVLPGGQEVWTYDPVTNSVTFDQLYRPEPGQTLTITYEVICY
ncbi:MAG: hypothetical protein IRZ16_18010 [Myxococcaceae bacterium]|nr:hypothetical protein [Myxococcaceae bacterium]